MTKEILWGSTGEGHPPPLFLLLEDLKRVSPEEYKKAIRRLTGKEYEIKYLNLGCGINVWNGEPEAWVNLDIDPSCFGKVNPDSKHGYDIVADAHHLPFKPDSFQYTLASEVLEHVDDPVQVLTEVRKVSLYLKLSVPDGLLKILMRLMNVEHPFIKDHKRYYTRSLLKKHLYTAGWHIQKILKSGSISILGQRFKFGNHFLAICSTKLPNRLKKGR